MRLVAHTIKGLEEITLTELKSKFKGFVLTEKRPKRVFFYADDVPGDSTVLRTFDDLSIFHQRVEDASLDKIVEVVGSLDLQINKPFSITVSIYKNKSISPDALKSVLAEKLAEKYKQEYTPLDHSSFDLRIDISQTEAEILVKVFPKSLFFRYYRVKSLTGSLRPSIAGAMLYWLTKSRAGLKVVDNLCGSGTFLCEALLDGNLVFGGDLSVEAVNVAKQNLSVMDSKAVNNVKVLDATGTKWPANFFDIAVSNLPWGKQVELQSITSLYSGVIKEYRRILKPDGKLCLLGSNPELIVKFVKEYFDVDTQNIETLRIGYLGQTPSIVFVAL